MKVQLAHILENLFHTSSLDEVPIERLQEIVKDHPYFSTGHFLLAQKMKLDDIEQFGDAVQKAAMYFHDPLWLHWQLDQQKKEVVHAPVATEVVHPMMVNDKVDQINEPTSIEQSQFAESADSVETIGGNGVFAHEDEVAYDEKEVEAEETFDNSIQDEHAGDEQAAIADQWEHPAGNVNEINASALTDNFEREDISSIEAPIEQTAVDETSQVDEISQELPAQSFESATDIRVETPEAIAGPETELEPPIEMPQEIVAEPPTRPSHQTITPEVTGPTPAFDPYYTIDYFASQGIKAPMDIQPGDKLGKQLKSFTEWLKTMKRLPQPQMEEQTDETEQQHIRQFAAGSLEKKEIVTETMAEVLIKQDKKEEAIAIYEKLSLLDPSKRAYFAAKIENLKVN